MEFRKKRLVVFGYNPWSKFWKRNQVMTYLLASKVDFDQVVFINPILWLGDLGNSKKLNDDIFSSVKKAVIPYKSGSNIYVWTPFVLPKTKFVISCFIRNLTKSTKKWNCTVLVNNPNHWLNLGLNKIRPSKLIFDWSDDFSQFCDEAQDRKRYESCINDIISAADKIICVNSNLYKVAKEINQNVLLMDNKSAINIDFSFDSPSRSPNDTVTLKYIDSLSGSIIGYVGWLVPSRLDCKLIEYLAKNSENLQFVFVGPSNSEFELHELSKRLKNVHVLRPVSFSSMSRLISKFNVCILPNKINRHTDGNSPIKLYDYLIMGKPVVATPTKGTELVSDYIYVSESYKKFSENINRALADDAAIFPRSRYEEFGWNSKIDSIISFLNLDTVSGENL